MRSVSMFTKARKRALIGATAVARTDLTPKGTVFLMGEYWNAVAEEGGTIKAGAPIDVVGREGFSLRVRAKSTDSPKGAEQKESPGRST